MVRLELYHPEVAFRSCEHCKRFVYDEETGAPRRNRQGELLPRVKLATLPCINDRCPKGTYEKPLQLPAAERRIIDLYKMAKATGGHCLNEAERRDTLVAHAMGLLDQEFERARAQSVAHHVAAIIQASK